MRRGSAGDCLSAWSVTPSVDETVKRRSEGESSDIGREQYRGGVTTASDGEKLPIKMLNDRILVKMDAGDAEAIHRTLVRTAEGYRPERVEPLADAAE